MRWLLSLFVFLIISVGQKTNAQEGLPFMTDVELSRKFSDSRIGSIVQNGEDVMLFSTSRGLLKYDGSEWQRIATPSPVLRVYHHKVSNRVFVGLKAGAAEVVKSDSGEYAIKPIAGISSSQSIQHVIGTDKEVFFIGENAVYALEPLSREAAESREFPSKFISGAFIYKKQLHILMYQEGLFRWEEEAELKKIPGHLEIAEDLVLFNFETTNGTFIGFENDLLYRFNGDAFQNIESTPLTRSIDIYRVRAPSVQKFQYVPCSRSLARRALPLRLPSRMINIWGVHAGITSRWIVYGHDKMY